MQYWLFPRRSSGLPLLAALTSLVLTACSTVPQQTSNKSLPVAKTPLSVAVSQTRNSESLSTNNSNAGMSADYYNTNTGNLYTQDEIDDLLGVSEMEAAKLSPEELAQFGNVWDRLRAGCRLGNIYDNQRIAVQRNWFAQRQDYLDRMTARASHYLYLTVTEAEKRGVPVELALLPVVESSYDPFAYSPAQAAGMWQFIPGTGKIYGLKQNWWYDGRRDVVASTRAAYNFLNRLYEKFGSWELALAAYNAGPGTIEKAINKNAAAGLPTDYWSLQLPAETMAYVPRFLAVVQLVKSPQQYGIGFRPIVNEPHFREVTTARSQVDLSAVAKLAGLTLKQLYQLNPGYTRWATDPEERHTLIVPANTPADFEERLASLPAPERLIVQRYRAKRGDTLSKIASRFGTSAADLKRMNHVSNKKGKVPAGQWLVISRTTVHADSYNTAGLASNRRLAQLASDDSIEIVNPQTNAADAAPPVPAPRVANNDAAKAADKDSDSKSDQTDKADNKKADKKADKVAVADKKDKASSKDDKNDSKVASRDKKDNNDDDNNVHRDYHKVRAGETLFRIATSYDVSPRDLARWNGMSVKDALRPGKRLVILVADNGDNDKNDKTDKSDKVSKNGTHKSTGKDRLANNDSKDDQKSSKDKDSKTSKKDSTRLAHQKNDAKDHIKQVRYEVRRGDTLYSISRRYNVSVSQIQTWNKGSRTIKPGQDIVLYLARN